MWSTVPNNEKYYTHYFVLAMSDIKQRDPQHGNKRAQPYLL